MTLSNSARRRWELARLVREEDGSPDRPVSVWAWSVPERIGLTADGQYLWSAGKDPHYATEQPAPRGSVRPSPRLLQRFLKLSDADAESIAKFARRWGVLDLCMAGMPDSRDGDFGELIVHRHGPECRPPSDVVVPGEPVAALERVEDWRAWSRNAVSVLNAAAAIHEGRNPEPEDMARIIGGEAQVGRVATPDGPDRASYDMEPADAASWIILFLSDWIFWADISPMLAWAPPIAPNVQLACHGLYGALVIQLLQAVTRGTGMFVCSGCGNWFMPASWPRSGTRRYCPECREMGVPQRDAQRDRRRRLRNGGSSVGNSQ